jgi:hypothetical protein
MQQEGARAKQKRRGGLKKGVVGLKIVLEMILILGSTPTDLLCVGVGPLWAGFYCSSVSDGKQLPPSKGFKVQQAVRPDDVAALKSSSSLVQVRVVKPKHTELDRTGLRSPHCPKGVRCVRDSECQKANTFRFSSLESCI